MKNFSHAMTLNTIRRTTTPEYLGPEATADDVRTYLELLATNWPAADAVQTVTFRSWCKGKRA